MAYWRIARLTFRMRGICPSPRLIRKTGTPAESYLCLSQVGGSSEKPTAAKCPLLRSSEDKARPYSSRAPNLFGLRSSNVSTDSLFTALGTEVECGGGEGDGQRDNGAGGLCEGLKRGDAKIWCCITTRARIRSMQWSGCMVVAGCGPSSQGGSGGEGRIWALVGTVH